MLTTWGYGDNPLRDYSTSKQTILDSLLWKTGMAILARHWRTLVFLGFAISMFGVGYSVWAAERQTEKFSPYVNEQGALFLPTNFRATFIHLGTFVSADGPDGQVSEMRGVYTRRQDLQAFLKQGKFPDGAILIKDVHETTTGEVSTGESSWSSGNAKLWFMMVKDEKGRFPENDLWGEGWGWAQFDGEDPKKNVATDYRVDCRECHLPVKKSDWLHLQGYQILKTQQSAH